MKTKLISCLLALLMIFAFSTVTMADSIQDGDQVYVSKLNMLYTVRDLAYQPLFETFCLEMNENLTGQPLTAHIDTYAIAGGVGGVNPGDPGDYISIETAFLYFSFRSGTIPDFDKGDVDDVTALQFAFWVLEDEIAFEAVNPILYSSWYQKFVDYLIFSESSDWQDIGPVKVLNLSNYIYSPNDFATDNGYIVQKQSLLTLVPEPISLLLLGLGLLGIGITRKRFAK